MNYRVFAFIVVILSAAILFSCSRPIQKKLAGMWKVEDVKFETSIPLDPAQVESSRESAKSLSYELLEDFTAKVHAGFSVLEGNWIYKEAEASVYMVFSGTSDTILLGRYEEGKLINEENRPDIKITTIFIKEDK
jgi:hypothetical protein